MIVNLTNEQKVQITLAPVTGAGHPAQLDGKPAWNVLSGNGTVEPSEDGKSATLVSSDDVGDTEIEISADADLGEGIVPITGNITMHVVSATAQSLGMSAGVPENK